MPHFFLFNQLTNKLVFAILYLVLNNYAALAQLVERFHGKEEVVGSSPTGGFIKLLETLVYQCSLAVFVFCHGFTTMFDNLLF